MLVFLFVCVIIKVTFTGKVERGIQFREVMTPDPRRFLRRRLYRYVSECEETRQETIPPTIQLVAGQIWSFRCTERKMFGAAS